MFEQMHFSKQGRMEIDYEMFIEADINAEEVQVVKIIKIEEKKKEV